jgi:hypothetical protein
MSDYRGGTRFPSGFMGGQDEPKDDYDVMQVCLNGHQITTSAGQFPTFRKDYCSDCGAKTIDQCPDCKAHIQGHYIGSMSISAIPVPNNCHKCGTAYPWRQEAIAAAIEAVTFEMDPSDTEEVKALVLAVSVDTPTTQLAAMKLRKVLTKMSKPVYDVSIKVLGDVAAATAKSHLGL